MTRRIIVIKRDFRGSFLENPVLIFAKSNINASDVTHLNNLVIVCTRVYNVIFGCVDKEWGAHIVYKMDACVIGFVIMLIILHY